MTYGTSYFVSRNTAIRYYSDYEPGSSWATVAGVVDRKLDEGAIHIGKPELKEGQTLSVIDNGTRYAITEGK